MSCFACGEVQKLCDMTEHFSLCSSIEDVGAALNEQTFIKLGKLAGKLSSGGSKHFRLGRGAVEHGARLGVTLQQKPE